MSDPVVGKVVINATNIGMGGGLVHLIEFLRNALIIDETKTYFVFAQSRVLNALPASNRIVPVMHRMLEKSLLHRLFFQIFLFDGLIPSGSIIFSVTGDYLGNYQPVVGMSQNMLYYERRHWVKMRMIERIRFFLNYHKQKWCFSRCSSIIFISRYSKDYVNKELSCIGKKSQTIIYHGVSQQFYLTIKAQQQITDYSFNNPFVFCYISNIHTYKNHPPVIHAIGRLRRSGFSVSLLLLGPVLDRIAGVRMKHAIALNDPEGEYIRYIGNIGNPELLLKYYAESDGLVYASSCETMPITILESMLSGRPLACSRLGPIPEILEDNAFYFNPEDTESIEGTLKSFLLNPDQRRINAEKAQLAALKYKWEAAAKETLDFIDQTYKTYNETP
jgi:glycosyltransferase involved in cell wall biosynthesis